MKVLVIVPAYNEENNIVTTIDGLKKNKSIDYVVINDGSLDNTKEVCEKNNINFIDLPLNLGIGGAVQIGYKYAFYHDYDIAIQFDGDNQHDPKYLDDLIKEIEKGYDIVIGSRYVKELSKFKSTFMRRVGINFLSFLIKAVTGKKVYDPTSGYRAVNKKVIELFAEDYPTDYPEPDSIIYLIKRGYKVSEIPVEMNERKEGKSSIGLFDSVYYMIKVSLCILMSAKRGKKERRK